MQTMSLSGTLVDALNRALDRRAATRPGSRDHWQAVCEVHRLQRLIVAEFRRDAVDPHGPDAEATPEAGVRAAGSCTVGGCDGEAMPPIGPGSDDDQALRLEGLCASHVLEATSA